MSTPTQRHTKSRRDRGRSHHALKPIALASCSNCQSATLPHHACSNCGYYRGRKVAAIINRLDRKLERRTEREKKMKEMGKQTGLGPMGQGI